MQWYERDNGDMGYGQRMPAMLWNGSGTSSSSRVVLYAEIQVVTGANGGIPTDSRTIVHFPPAVLH